MPIAPRPEVAALAPVAHGGLDYAELERLGLGTEDIVDFSVNTNPLGPSPRVRQALAEADIARYPDPEATALRRALARKTGVAPENILCGNGSAELMRLMGWAFLSPGDRVVIVGPTFGEYEATARMVGAQAVAYRAEASGDFQPDGEAIAELVRQVRPRMVFLCNPNNPTGQCLNMAAIERILCACAEGLLVLDEAYVNFAAEAEPSVPLLKRGNLVILRSMTKDYALAGLRLGYALAPPQVLEALRRIRPPWNVNALAQAAGLAALEDEAHLARARALVAGAKEYLAPALRRLGLRPLPSVTNFFLVEVGDGPGFRARLLRRAILVRDCSSFGLPHFIRIGARPLSDCERLVQAVAEVR